MFIIFDLTATICHLLKLDHIGSQDGAGCAERFLCRLVADLLLDSPCGSIIGEDHIMWMTDVHAVILKEPSERAKLVRISTQAKPTRQKSSLSLRVLEFLEGLTSLQRRSADFHSFIFQLCINETCIFLSCAFISNFRLKRKPIHIAAFLAQTDRQSETENKA